MHTRRSSMNLGLLDTIIILVLAFTADLLLLWIASQIKGLDRFEHPPQWLADLSKSIWSYLTGAASSFFLAFLRRRINGTTKTPNYLLWSGGSAIAILLMLILVTWGIPVPPPPPQPITNEFDLKFHVRADNVGHEPGSRQPQVLAFQQIHPNPKERENIAPQPDGFYKSKCDLPPRCGQFLAHAFAVQTEGELRDDPTSSPLEISFVRRSKDPEAQGAPEVLAECERKNCSISKLDLGWASDGKDCSTSSGELFPRFVAVAYALEMGSDGTQPGWRVPSLETLSSMKDREKVGYTKFLIKSGPLASLSQADAFTYYIKVNGTPIYVDGSPPEDMIQPFSAPRGVDFAFGLENLNFSGADRGCENISVLFEFRKQNQVIQRAELTRKYAALRNADEEQIRSKEGISFTWSGDYVKPRNEDRFEVFIGSTLDVDDAARIKARLDKVKLRFRDLGVVGVVRPPLDRNAYGVALGLVQPTGQVRFTFNGQTRSVSENYGFFLNSYC